MASLEGEEGGGEAAGAPAGAEGGPLGKGEGRNLWGGESESE